MTKRNKKLDTLFHVFTADEVAAFMFQIRTKFCKRNVKDEVILSNVCEALARENLRKMNYAHWSEHNVKILIENNTCLYRPFVDYINDSFGLKYNLTKNRVYVQPEYWQVKSKETEDETLFRECGFPLFNEWWPILEAHRPAIPMSIPIGLSHLAPIVVKDEPFEAGTMDDAKVRARRNKKIDGPIHPDKLSTL